MRLLALTAFAAAVWGIAQGDSPDPDRDAAYAAALGFAAPQLVEGRPPLCIAIGDTDPTDRFLRRIAYEGPVRKASECESSARGVTLRGSETPALALTASSADRVSEDEIWVEVRYVRNAVNRAVRRYRVVRQAAAWVALGQIIRDTPL